MQTFEEYVSKDSRGLGVGKLLLKETLNEIKKMKRIKKIKIEVTTIQKTAMNLYEKFGFEKSWN